MAQIVPLGSMFAIVVFKYIYLANTSNLLVVDQNVIVSNAEVLRLKNVNPSWLTLQHQQYQIYLEIR